MIFNYAFQENHLRPASANLFSQTNLLARYIYFTTMLFVRDAISHRLQERGALYSLLHGATVDDDLDFFETVLDSQLEHFPNANK